MPEHSHRVYQCVIVEPQKINDIGEWEHGYSNDNNDSMNSFVLSQALS